MPSLSARALSMEFPGVKALSGVNFDLEAGEIHALCGENGAGKSTLINILGGVLPHGSYGGRVESGGSVCRFAGPADALRAGIRVIHQELALCEDLSVAENICLGSEPVRFGPLKLLDNRSLEKEARIQLDKLGLAELDPRAPVRSLPVGFKQMVEIARALRGGAPEGAAAKGLRVLILDEPTSALSAREAERLETTLRALREEGYALLYISHRLDEVFRLADRVTVLRNGESAGTLARGGFDADRIVSLMVGRRVEDVFPVRSAPPADAGANGTPLRAVPPLLSVGNWTVPSPGNPDKPALENISFELRAGEILGLVGLMGAGRTELAESLCGLFPLRGRGDVRVEGEAYVPRDGRLALDRGLALLSEDRRGRGIMPGKSLRANMTYSALRKYCYGGWLLRPGRELEAVNAQIDSQRIKAPGADSPIDTLSGGNQQKVMLSRILLTRPKLLILDEPTRGIDVGAKAEIYRLIQRLASEGMGVLLISSENEEVLRLSHRVLILRAGRIVAARGAEGLELEEALALASGAQAA